MCARRATDRDLEGVGATFCANTWTNACSRQATDRHLEKVSAVRKVNGWICASLTTDHDPASVIPDQQKKKQKKGKKSKRFELRVRVMHQRSLQTGPDH